LTGDYNAPRPVWLTGRSAGDREGIGVHSCWCKVRPVCCETQSRPSTRRSTPMSKHNTRTTTGLLFLGMIAAAPMAFAQSTTPTTQQTPTQSATGAAEQQRQQSGASGQGMGWADLDTDGNGSISRTEAQAHSALSSVFATADADGDGELTADEYRTFIQNQQQGGAAQE